MVNRRTSSHRRVFRLTVVLCLLAGISPLVCSTPAFSLTVEAESVLDATSDSATFQAEVGPKALNMVYEFEYGTTPSYGKKASSTELGLGGSAVDTILEAHVQGLTPNTIYHFRLAARDANEIVFDGADKTFTTQAASQEFVLLDDRMWELVSPLNKQGAGILPISTGIVEASSDGKAVTYLADAPIEAEPEGNTNLTQVLSQHIGGDWSSQDIATPHNGLTGESVGEGQEYRAFSPDLTTALVEPRGATPLPPLTQGAEKTVYLRDNRDGNYLPLVTATNTTSGEKFGGQQTELGTFFGGVSIVSATPDLSHVVLSAEARLTATPNEAEHGGLYEWAGGILRLIGGEELEPEIGEIGKNVRNAISDTGSRIFYSYAVNHNRHLYMRDMTTDETIQVDAAQEGEPEPSPGPARFQIATKSGTMVFFTDDKKLTTTFTGKANEPDLYVFEVMRGKDQELGGRLADLTIDRRGGESANVQGTVLGVGEEPSSKEVTSIYFVAWGELTDMANERNELAIPGANNLYIITYDSGTKEWSEPKFITDLSSNDSNDWEGGSLHDNLAKLTSRVSPNGDFLTFMSERSLTGYDNVDARNSSAHDEEVFLYNAGTNQLTCVSCNPTDSRPLGVDDLGKANGGHKLLVDSLEIWENQWLAGSIPGWTPESAGYALYQSRYLSNDGRLFFDSADALLPQDTNGTEDVYEYEPAEVGSCTRMGTTFSNKSGGCIGLISSGTSGDESAFMDASENGEDVFFVTSARLIPNDTDTAFDVYDAHICTSTSPCLTEPVPPPECTTVDSCRQAPPPQPTFFGASGSAKFVGTGNLQSRIVKPTAKKRKKKMKGSKKRRRRGGRANMPKAKVKGAAR